MRAIVCGGRDYHDRDELFRKLDDLHAEFTLQEIAHGGAKGADILAADWAKDRGIKAQEFKANWIGRPKTAGMVRNGEMLREFKPDAVIWFPGGKGTQNMVERAIRAGVRILAV